MNSEWKYRGRVVTAEEIVFIRELIAANREASRRELSRKLCEAGSGSRPTERRATWFAAA